MKKTGKRLRSIFIASAILLIFSGVFSACKEKENTVKRYLAEDGRFDINETEFVRIYFSPQSGFVNSQVELIFENHTKGVLNYGAGFSLEYFDNENWKKIPLDIVFDDMLCGLLAGETHKEMFNLSMSEEYNNGKKGKYRYVKNFDFSYNFPFEIDSSFNLYATFEIK